MHNLADSSHGPWFSQDSLGLVATLAALSLPRRISIHSVSTLAGPQRKGEECCYWVQTLVDRVQISTDMPS